MEPHRTGREDLPYLRVAIILCNSFTLTAMSGFVDALRLAADRGDRSRQVYFSWTFLAGVEGPVRASNGLPIDALPNGAAAAQFDCAVVCGGRLEALDETAPWVDVFLRQMARKNAPVVGLCTGTFILARAGLLDGRRCALHFETAQTFAARFPAVTPVTNCSHVIDGPILTCPGGVASAWLATLIIAAYSNRARANKALAHLLLDYAPPNLNHAPAEWKAALKGASTLTQKVVEAMEFSLDAPCSIEDLARKVNVSKSTLTRSFTADMGCAPARFWMQLRLQAAKELLQGRKRSITEIAYETGFCDTAHLSSAFRRAFGMTPRAFQQSCANHSKPEHAD